MELAGSATWEGGVQRTEYSGGGDFGREVICAHSGAEQTRAAGVPGKIK